VIKNLFCLLIHSGKSQRTNRFEFRFRTDAENGLILWLSRGHSLQADYFAVALVHSRLELSFNLGKQSSFLSARSTVSSSFCPLIDLRFCTKVSSRTSLGECE